MAETRLLSWIIVVIVSAAAGALHSVLFDAQFQVRSIVYGFCIGVAVIYYERGALTQAYRQWVRGLPTLAYLLLAEINLLLVVLVGTAIAGGVVWLFELTDQPLQDALIPSPISVVYSMVVSATFVFVFRIRDLIGGEIFTSLILGRYHRPISEERVFLFLDLVGSTAYARDHGDLAAQELLKAVFAAIAEPVRLHHGQVDDYIGDQVIISWPIKRGIEHAHCIACTFVILTKLERSRAQWLNKFKQCPELRAALHGGHVVTAEVGVDRHKIAYFGDVMNTTARLEQLCRQQDEKVLISDTLLRRVDGLPAGVVSKMLGHFDLRGRDTGLAVHSLSLE